MRKILFICFIVFISMGWLGANPSSREMEVKKFVENVIEDTVNIISSKKSDGEIYDALESRFFNTVDEELMAKLAIGKYWRQFNDVDKEKYLALYKKILAVSYVPKFRYYNSQQISVASIKSLSETRYVAYTIISEGETNYEVAYFINSIGDGEYRVFDIVAEGVSLIATQRSDFSGVISQSGMDKFLDVIEQKVKELQQNSKV